MMLILSIEAIKEKIPLVFALCWCCSFLYYFLSGACYYRLRFLERNERNVEQKRGAAFYQPTNPRLPPTPSISPAKKKGENTTNGSTFVNDVDNQSELVVISSSISGSSSSSSSDDRASPNLPLSPVSHAEEVLHVSFNSILKEERNRTITELSIDHLTKVLNGMTTELSNAKDNISKLETELSILHDVKATMEPKIIELEDSVRLKNRYIDHMHRNLKTLIYELTEQPQDNSESATPDATLDSTCLGTSPPCCRDASDRVEDELLCMLRSVAFFIKNHGGRQSYSLRKYGSFHTERMDSVNEDLFSIQSIAHYLEQKNTELQMQLTKSSEKLHNMDLLHESEKSEYKAKYQEMLQALSSREAEILQLNTASHDLNEELKSVRLLLAERDEKLSTLEAAAIEDDMTKHQLLTKLIQANDERTCIAEERSILQQQLADTLQNFKNESAVAATKLQESYDALSRKEEEVKLVTKEFGLIQSELFSVMEQLNVEMKDLQDNVSSLREIVNEKDRIIEGLQKHKSIRCNCTQGILPFKEVNFNTETAIREEAESSRELAEFGAILLGSESPFFNFSQSSVLSGVLTDKVDTSSSGVPTMVGDQSLKCKNNDTSVTTDDDPEKHVDLADLLFGRGTTSLLRTSKNT